MDVETEPDWHKHIDVQGGDVLDRIASAVLDDAKRLVPVSRDGSNGNPPGHLRRSLRKVVGETSARVGSDVDYSVWVEEGHRVAYRNAQGVVVYTGAVVPPEPYLKPSLYRKRVLE